MNALIRQATLQDLNLVSEILSEAAAWLEECGIPLWTPSEVATAAIESDVENGFYFLALQCGMPAGTFKYQPEDALIWPDARNGEASYIHLIVSRYEEHFREANCHHVSFSGRRSGHVGRDVTF